MRWAQLPSADELAAGSAIDDTTVMGLVVESEQRGELTKQVLWRHVLTWHSLLRRRVAVNFLRDDTSPDKAEQRREPNEGVGYRRLRPCSDTRQLALIVAQLADRKVRGLLVDRVELLRRNAPGLVRVDLDLGVARALQVIEQEVRHLPKLRDGHLHGSPLRSAIFFSKAGISCSRRLTRSFHEGVLPAGEPPRRARPRPG